MCVWPWKITIFNKVQEGCTYSKVTVWKEKQFSNIKKSFNGLWINMEKKDCNLSVTSQIIAQSSNFNWLTSLRTGMSYKSVNWTYWIHFEIFVTYFVYFRLNIKYFKRFITRVRESQRMCHNRWDLQNGYQTDLTSWLKNNKQKDKW